MSNQNTIQYRRVGDYLIPNLILPPEEARVTLGKWGMMHKLYLEKHKKVLFNTLLIQGKLYQHCGEVEKHANEMYDILVKRMAENDGVTEELKASDQMRWIGLMNNYRNCAEEIICSTVIFA